MISYILCKVWHLIRKPLNAISNFIFGKVYQFEVIWVDNIYEKNRADIIQLVSVLGPRWNVPWIELKRKATRKANKSGLGYFYKRAGFVPVAASLC